MPPSDSNPFSSFAPEDQLDIHNQLVALYGSGKLNPLQQQGAGHALKMIAAASGVGGPTTPPELTGPATNNYEAVPGSDSPQAQAVRLGQMVPDAATPALATATRQVIDPFNKFIAQTGQTTGNLAEHVVMGLPEAPGAETSPEDLAWRRAHGIPAITPQQDQDQLALARIDRPILTASAHAVGSLAGETAADPRQWPLLFAGGDTVRPLFAKLMSVGFGAQMSADTLKGATDLSNNWDSYSPYQRYQQITSLGLTGTFAALSAAHVASAHAVTPDESLKSVIPSGSPKESSASASTQTSVASASSPSASIGFPDASQPLVADADRRVTPTFVDDREMPSRKPTESPAPEPIQYADTIDGRQPIPSLADVAKDWRQTAQQGPSPDRQLLNQMALNPSPDVGMEAREALPVMPRGERRAQPRTPEEIQTQTLFAKARTELGEDASSDDVMSRVEQLKQQQPSVSLPMAPSDPWATVAADRQAQTLAADELGSATHPDFLRRAQELKQQLLSGQQVTPAMNSGGADGFLRGRAMDWDSQNAKGVIPDGPPAGDPLAGMRKPDIDAAAPALQQPVTRPAMRLEATLAPPKPVEAAPKKPAVSVPAAISSTVPTALAKPSDALPETDSARIQRHINEVEGLLKGDPAVKAARETRQQIPAEVVAIRKQRVGLRSELAKVRQNADMAAQVPVLQAQINELTTREGRLVQAYRGINGWLGDQPTTRYTKVNYSPEFNERLAPEAKAKAQAKIQELINRAHGEIRDELKVTTDPTRKAQLERWLDEDVIKVQGKGIRSAPTVETTANGPALKVNTPEITLKTVQALSKSVGDGKRVASLLDLVPEAERDQVRELKSSDPTSARQAVQDAARKYVEQIRDNLHSQLSAAKAREAATPGVFKPSTPARNIIDDLKAGKRTMASLSGEELDHLLSQPGVIAQEFGPNVQMRKKGSNGQGTVLEPRDLGARFIDRLRQEKASRTGKPTVEGVIAQPKRSSAEAGFATPGMLFDARKLPGELWRRFVADPLLRKAGMGAKYHEIREMSPTLADLFRQRDNAPAAYRQEAAQNVKNILGGADHAKERLAALWADADSRANLAQNHPAEYRQAQNDPEVQGIVARYQKYANDLTQERQAAGFATVPEDYLRRVYDEHMGQTSGQPFEKAVSFQDLPKKSRQATAEYHYQNGTHEFGPAYGTKYIAQKLIMLDRTIVEQMANEGTMVPKAGNLPSDIQFNGKTYYSPDQAKIVKSKDVYGVYDPLKTTKFKVGDSAILAPKNIVDVASAVDRGNGYKPGWLKQTFQKGVIGLGAGIPHAFANVPRRIMNSFEGGMANPKAWVASFKVLFGKELRQRAELGPDDPTLQALMRRGAARFDVENTSVGSKWPLLSAGHNLIYKPGTLGGLGGVDVRARMEYADRLINQNPHMTLDQVSEKVENQFGKYTKENWTKTQQGMAHVVAFPGWIYSSIRAGLEHPLRATVPAAAMVYAINQALNKKGLNRVEDKDDISRIHVGDYALSPTVFSEPFAKAVAGPTLAAAQSLIRGGSKREIASQAEQAVPRSIGKASYVILPYYAVLMEVMFNRQFAGTEKEVFRPGAFDRKGKYGLREGTEAILQHLGTRVIPQLGRLAPEGETGESGLDIPSFIGSQVGMPAFKQDAEARLLKNVAVTGQASHLKDDYSAQRPTELEQLYKNEPALPIDDGFHKPFEQLEKAVKTIDNEIIAFPDRKQQLEAARAVVLAASDNVNDKYQEARQRLIDAKTDKPIDKLKRAVGVTK